MTRRNDSLIRILSAFVEGETEPDDLALLEEALHGDLPLLRELAELLAVDSLLRQQAEVDGDGFMEALRFRLEQPLEADSGFEASVLGALATVPGAPAGAAPDGAVSRRGTVIFRQPGLRLPRWRTVFLTAATLTGAAAAVAAVFLALSSGPPDAGLTENPPTSGEVRWLARAVRGVTAQVPPTAPPVGETLAAGTYELAGGEVLLTFRNGVQVTVRGPAKWELHDLTRMTVTRGVVRVKVPDNARGFTVRSGGMDFQDLGTEFGVRADDAGGGSVMQVFSGAVDVLQAESREKLASLTSGQAYGVSVPGGQSGPAAMQPLSAFPDPQELALRRWEEASVRLDQDPALLAHFPLRPEVPPGPTLTSTAAAGLPPGAQPLGATVTGCQWVTGRWPGKPALQFENPGDAVRFELPGTYTDLTACFWLKLDRVIHPWTFFWGSPRLTDSTLQFCMHGAIQHFSAQAVAGKGTKTTSVNCTKPLGTWMQITLVLDSASRETRLYVDGVRSSCYTWTRPGWEFRPGHMTIGRCDDPEAPDAREFRGRLDEFALWRRALSEGEIRQFFQNGQPAPP